jgi:anti-sigma factor RsiW
MKHLRDSEIQAYIDGELSPRQVNRVERHLQECQECTARVEKQRARVMLVRSAWGSLSCPEIKPLRFPTQNTNANVDTACTLPLNRNIWLRIASSVAAVMVLVLAIALVIRQNTMGEIIDMTGSQIIVRYEIEDEFDANRPITEQNYVFRVYQQ